MFTEQNEEHSDAIFQMLLDTESHKVLLEQILRQLSYEENYSIKEVELEFFKVMNQIVKRDKCRISDLEYQAFIFYRGLLRFFSKELEHLYSQDISQLVVELLERLVDDERRHFEVAKMIEGDQI